MAPEKALKATNGSANKKAKELNMVRRVIIDSNSSDDEDDIEMEQMETVATVEARKTNGKNAQQSTSSSSTSSSATSIGAKKFQTLLKKRADIDAKLLESINSMKSDLLAFREANKNLLENEKKTKAELAATKREGNKANEKICVLTEENQHLKVTNEEQKKQSRNLENHADVLQNELTNAKNVHSNALDELTNCRQKCGQLEKQIAVMSANLKTKTNELAISRKETEEYREKFERLKDLFAEFSSLIGSNSSRKKAARNEKDKQNSTAFENSSIHNISISDTFPTNSLRQNMPILESPSTENLPSNSQSANIEQFSPITISATNRRKNRQTSCQIVEEFLDMVGDGEDGEVRPKEWPLLTLDADGNVALVEESDNSMDETVAMGKSLHRTNSKIVVENDESESSTPENRANENGNAEFNRLVLDPRPSTSGTQSANNSASSYSLRHTIKSRDGLKRGRRDLNEQFGIFHPTEQQENEMNAENKKKKIGGRKTQ